MSSSVPEGWKEDFIGTYVAGSVAGEWGKEARGDKNDIPVLRATNFTENGAVDYKKLAIRNIDEKKRVKKLLKTGDIVLEKSGGSPTQPVGRVIYFDNEKPFLYSNFTQKISPTNKCVSKYLFYKLYHEYQQGTVLKFQQQTTGIINFQLAEYLLYKTIFPPLPEQKKIAAILTSVDTVIEKTQAQIDKLKDLKTGMMQELLTKGIGHTEFKDSPVGRIPVEWEVKDLGDLAFKIEGGGTPPRKNPDYWGKGYPWATVKDLKSIRLSSTEESITKTGLINSSSKLVPAGTVILATRMAVGKAVVFDCDVTINQDLKAFYPKEKLNNKFLLQWYLYKSKYIASLGTGSTVKGIRVDDLKLLTIAVPPYDEQIIIANKIEGIEVLLNHKIAKIQKMTSLKKALMQDLLTGKVRVKV